MSATRVQHPITDHLWQLGFTLKTKVERLPMPIVREGTPLLSRFTLTAYPDRGEARRHFSRKGPAASEVMSNCALEMFGVEKDEGRTDLKDTYTEKCAVILQEMLSAEVPTLRQPVQSGAAS